MGTRALRPVRIRRGRPVIDLPLDWAPAGEVVVEVLRDNELRIFRAARRTTRRARETQ